MDSKVSQHESMDFKRMKSPDSHTSESSLRIEKPREHSLKSKHSPLSPPSARLNIVIFFKFKKEMKFIH